MSRKLPNTWELAPLGKLVLPKEGIRRGPFGGALKKDIFVDDGYKVYQQGNVIRCDWNYGEYYIDEKKYNEMLGFQIRPGDFLVSCSGTIGRIVIVPESVKSGVINQALLRIRLNTEIIDPTFFLFQFRSGEMQRLIVENTQGGAMQNLVSMDVFREVEFTLPPLPEQRKIAEILSTWDEAIAASERLLASLRQRKKGLMQRLLSGQVRFVGFDGEWNEKFLGDISTRIVDGTHKTPEYVEIGVPFISTNNLVPFSAEFNFRQYEKYIKPEEHRELTRRCNPEVGDLLISKCGTIGRTQMIRKQMDFSIFVGLALVKLDTRRILPEFLEQLLNTDIYQKQMEILAPGGTRATLTIGELKKLNLKFPESLIEQKKISDMLNLFDQSIVLYEKKLSMLQQQKKGLMQRLLTGQVRVRV
jgi:type I restriction enzyme, S subunit